MERLIIRSMFVGMLTAVALLPAAATSIYPLPPASYSEVASESFVPLSLPYQASTASDTTVSVSKFGATVTAETGSASGGSASASLLASESSSAFFSYLSGFASGGSVQYSIELIGPQGTPGFAVPVTMSASGVASGIENTSGLGSYGGGVTFSASASIELSGSGVQTGPSGGIGGSTMVSQANSGTQTFEFTQQVMFSPDVPVDVTLYAETGATLDCFGCGGSPNAEERASAFASIDPGFALGPEFVGQYSFVVSPGISLTPVAVPEPAYLRFFAAVLSSLVSLRVVRWALWRACATLDR